MWKKKIDPSDIIRYETVLQVPTRLNSQSLASVHFVSESGDFNAYTHDGYWRFFKTNFYNNSSSYPYDTSSLISNFHGYGPFGIGTHYNKFNQQGRVISISQKDFGDGIVPGTFILRDNYFSSSIDSTIKPILRDDGRGNLYSNSDISASDGSVSSSANHIGNIFYDWGMIVLKDTGSWSGSMSNDAITSNGNYLVDFKAKHTLYTIEYNLRIEPDEFLHTSNITSRAYLSGSSSITSSRNLQSPFYLSKLTSSIGQGFACVTTIGLYNQKLSEPIIIARLPKALKRHTSVPITFKLKLDMIV